MVVKERAALLASAAPPLDLNRTSGTPRTSVCPKAGWVRLTHYDGRGISMPTACKTWRCLSCGDRLRNLFRMGVVSGCSALAHCWLITFTYKVSALRREDAQFAKKDWREFWRRWNKDNPNLEWLRVSETTKEGMIHHHVVATSETTIKASCYGREFSMARFLRRFHGCGCLSHRVARIWKAVTGDSYMVHVAPVVSPRGVGSYLAKYMMKDFGKATGPMRERRWSSSRGWPGTGRLRLTMTVRKMWAVVAFHNYRATAEDLVVDDPELSERSGPAWLKPMMERWAEQAAMNGFRRFMNEHSITSAQVLPGRV